MGSTSASLKGSANEAAYNQVKLTANSEIEYKGLEQAMRAAVEGVIQSDPAVKAAIANAVRVQIINKFNAAQIGGAPWPFPLK
ncbi:MAG: hypothetical protein ACREPG_02545 [Candidatus Binatia bacterium]